MVMIQFNIHRFGKLARWSLVNDKKYYIKAMLHVFAVLVFFFLFFTYVMRGQAPADSYKVCCFIVVTMLIATFVLGPSSMFYSMEGKHDRQTLLMLPASNLEKFLMRYATWMLLLPLYLVAFLGADVLQYVFNQMVGREYVTFVTSTLMDSISRMQQSMPDNVHSMFWNSLWLLAVWFHSLYALGATFFRTRRFNWVLTTIVIILLTILQAWAYPYEEFVSDCNASTTTASHITNLVALCWVVLNFWLSYRLFCRQQVIGKFVNM